MEKPELKNIVISDSRFDTFMWGVYGVAVVLTFLGFIGVIGYLLIKELLK